VSPGGSVVLTANVGGGTPPYTYQWYSGTSADCFADTAISGATEADLSVLPANSTYYCYSVSDNSTTPPTEFSSTDLVTVGASPVGWTLFGLSGTGTDLLLGGIAAAVVVVALVIMVRLRKRPRVAFAPPG